MLFQRFINLLLFFYKKDAKKYHCGIGCALNIWQVSREFDKKNLQVNLKRIKPNSTVRWGRKATGLKGR